MSNAFFTVSRQATAIAKTVGAMAGLALALGACKSVPGLYDDTPSVSYTEKFRPGVNQGDIVLKLPISNRVRRFTRYQLAEIESYLSEYKLSQTGPLIISRPKGSANEKIATSATAEINRMARRAGIARGSTIMKTYYAGRARRDAPVVLTYPRRFANSARCGDWSTNLAVTYDNRPYPNFSCAHYNNLAAMVSNPRDLHTPRAMDPANAARRDVMLEHYRKGEPTGTKRTADETGKVSDVAK